MDGFELEMSEDELCLWRLWAQTDEDREAIRQQFEDERLAAEGHARANRISETSTVADCPAALFHETSFMGMAA